ncbi:unnamed protein product [Arctia plantaginis]|uniref:Uncharacterized protein n=1 Tax=Arctia plantaginis TaxID=874455 RepID=A0A8S0ZK34_ARCPL|nr:unnamed protein product [Arctia plantaginis]
MAEHLQEQILQLQAEKAALLLRLEQENKAEEQRVRQLIGEEELGDRRPSQFLRHLRSLSGNVLSDDNILRQLWLRRLPQQVQAILASQLDLDLNKLAELADKVMEIASPNQIYTCAAPTTSSSVLETLQLLDKPPEAAVLPQADNMSTEPASSAAVPKNSSTSTQQTPYVTRSGRRVRFKTLD